MADALATAAKDLALKKALTVAGLHSKFSVESGYDIAFGGLDVFFTGLEGMLGPPNPNLATQVCIYIYVYMCLCFSMYVCMYIFYVCIYVMYVCIYIYIYIYTPTNLQQRGQLGHRHRNRGHRAVGDGYRLRARRDGPVGRGAERVGHSRS